MKTKLLVLAIALTTTIISANQLIGKVILNAGKVMEAYDIYDTSEFAQQTYIHYERIRIGYREKIGTRTTFLRDENGKVIRYLNGKAVTRTKKIKIKVKTIILWSPVLKEHFWVEVKTGKLYRQGGVLVRGKNGRAYRKGGMIIFSTLGWKKLTQKEANMYFSAPLMEALKSAYAI